MRNSFYLFLFFLIIQVNAFSNTGNSSLVLSTELISSSDESVLVSVSICNKAEDAVIIPVVLIPEYRYLSMNLISKDGELIRPRLSIMDYRESLVDIVRMRPNECYTAQIELTDYYEIEDIRHSRIQFSYDLSSQHNLHQTASNWSGAFYSNMIDGVKE